MHKQDHPDMFVRHELHTKMNLRENEMGKCSCTEKIVAPKPTSAIAYLQHFQNNLASAAALRK